ncbi:RICIN domain-containing protein [Streptomyces sp. NPDC055992]|uniref:RICIN domain-containing protein n=1 Tax=Streptomyces sp. NPDC055992 TaxID=3345673 RepID=UPI0035D6C8FA
MWCRWTCRPDYDWYALHRLEGTAPIPRLRVHNTTGLDRLAYARGTRTGSPTTALTSLGTQGCLDAPGATTAVHTQVATYACNGGDNQRWKLTA